MSFEAALQEAIYLRLSTYPGLPTIYDHVPQDHKGNVIAPFPYVVIGEDTHLPWSTDDSVGAEATLTLHIWSRAEGKKETKEIQGLIHAALDRYELSVDGHHLVTLDFDYSDVFLDEDGQTRHGISRYRTLVEQDASTA